MPSTFILPVLLHCDRSSTSYFLFTHFLNFEQETYRFMTNR